ncbi:MAG: hypothetical protein A3J94_00050 [Syntrophus sp. RIFOXYC2_FULL_54_9]|nr:MAG: hypothetical protein A2X92_00020 [Syntrophus sp. GWC2_56_31]OHE30099.1 MAG: hypothetical protein A3J94_00050 [Syntrophus sp. RIFOXYC2_FULL_54_9]HBB16449.1 hypothetical protein [Syntrophus sp. (in: bacteria)]
MDKLFKLVICILLSSILLVQVLILQRMPPTINEIRSANNEDRQKIRMKIPVVNAVITQPVQVEIDH